jgi:tetratricopeptide (TPR) repeat protein
MKIPIFAWAGGAMAVFCAAGCVPGQAHAVDKAISSESSSAMPDGDPSERLDEQRLTDATKGLVISGGLIAPSASVRPNPQAGEKLRQQAIKITGEHNTWFLSVAAYRDAILADPTNAKSYEGLAKSFLMEGKTSFAKPALASAIKLDPKFSLARYELGLVRQMESDYAGAVTEWKALVKLDPGYGDTYARMSIASYYAQDYSSSWKYLTEARSRHEDVPPQFPGLLKEADPQP